MAAYDTIAAANGTLEFPLAGETVRVRTLKLKEWAPLQAWLVTHFPGPLARAAAAIKQSKALGAPLDPDTEEALLDHAQAEQLGWPPRVGSKAWVGVLDTEPAGLVQFLHTVLTASDPDVTRDQVEALAGRVAQAPAGSEVGALFRWAVGGIRPDQEPPKGEGAPGPAPQRGIGG